MSIPMFDAEIPLPETVAAKLMEAIENKRIGMVLVVSDQIVDNLAEGKLQSLGLADGGIVILIPEKLLKEYYGGKNIKGRG